MQKIAYATEEWLREEIIKYQDHQIPFECSTGISIVKKYIVLKLANWKIPFKVINLGCGVTKITTITNTCPKCNGTGSC